MNNNEPTMSMYIIDELMSNMTTKQLESQLFAMEFAEVFDDLASKTKYDSYLELIKLCRAELERRKILAIRRSEVEDDLPL